MWDVNERFGLDLPEDLFETIGGFVFGQLGRIAETGDEIEYGEARFRVESMDGRRVERVALVRSAAPKGDG